ncbi:binding-protein-dependent transport systems inner membrane component [Ignisphaera aggregans DSM 17230]|uniref:Binding-protein-dependent transport systems inner membrane component n=1 Tax=Ignisphaera aggregans (strain DSM 17230 / JCM 13409 / AQ1.S1) TaxID=583356 RepID=E0SSL6_IGNAA|nr:binding-protein-dependent transport systems inner membrane component [Ignisphaera aggregans DSM 17230]
MGLPKIDRTLAIYLAKRIVLLVVAYFIAITIVFLLPRIIPGNPLATKMQQIISMYIYRPEMVGQVYRELINIFQFDKPWYIQYINFLSRAFRGDLGISTEMYPRKVTDVIAMSLPWTLALVVPATMAAWFTGNIIGAYAGYKRGGLFEKFVVGYSFIVSRIPYFWLAILLLFAFAFRLRWFPTGGIHSPYVTPSLSAEFIIDYLWHYALPFLSIYIVDVAGWMGSMRILVSSELASDYLLYAETIGVKDRTLFRYAYRNSLLPQVTGLALQLGFSIVGVFIVEVVFNYPGMGYMLSRAIGGLDYPLIQGIFLITVATIFLANFLVDFVYVLIDPRVRIGGRG